MKKTLATALCLFLILPLLLTACSGGEPAAGLSPSDTAQDGDSVVSPAGTFPIVEEKITLTAWSRQFSAMVADFVDNEFTKWYEDYTNIHIEWNLAPDNELVEKLNLILASGDYPDMLLEPWTLTNSQVMTYGDQGVFIPLNDLIEEYGVETKPAIDQVPPMWGLITQPNGNIYSLPHIDDCFHCKYSWRMWAYQPWMDELRIETPTTTEEFYQMLKAFKEQDPNGNGEADEVPLIGYSVGAVQPTILNYIMSSFIYVSSVERGEMFNVNNNVVQPVFDKPEWREGLRYLNKLYSEGLIAPETFTQDAPAMQQFNSGDIRLGAVPGSTPWTAMPNSDMADHRWADYTPIPPLEGPGGLRVARTDHYNLGPTNVFTITSACEYPEAAFRWADALYDQEMTLRKYYGRPDEEWRYATEGEIGINGLPAIWATLAEGGGEVDQPNDKSWAHIGPHNRSDAFRLGQVVMGDPQFHSEAVLYQATKENYEPYASDISNHLPPLVFTEEQSAEIADLQTTIDLFVQEMFARFVSGDADIETEWDAYIEQLENMNLARYVEITQAAYDLKWSDR